ncbi:hypothetical protein OIU78_019201 [Salix suchowensis]|nr:hypothetical protein OIU78_019201 [Salix suchowensis]
MRLTLFWGASALNFSNTLPKLEIVASTNFTAICSFSVSQYIRRLNYYYFWPARSVGTFIGLACCVLIARYVHGRHRR